MLMMSRKKTMNPEGDVILLNEAIQRVTKAKFLGVIVDKHLFGKTTYQGYHTIFLNHLA